jgi:hypothetical protein
LHNDLGNEDESFRIFNCARCYQQVKICRNCDRGNRYCSSCSEVARQESIKRAQVRYQNSSQGQELNRCRQKRSRQRARSASKVALCTPLVTESETINASTNGCDSLAEAESLITEPQAELQFSQFHEPNKSSVTDQGSPFGSGHEIVTAAAITKSHWQSKPNESLSKVQCDMCGAWCGPFARRKPWHRGRRWTNTQRGKP